MARFGVPAAAVAFLSGALALHPILTPDLWWHLASGRWILQHRDVPRTDVFSYTMQSHEWVNLQWLTDVLFVSIWRWAGPEGLVLFKVGLLATTWVVLLAAGRTASRSVPAATIAVALAILASAERTLVRPELFTGLGLAVVLWLVQRARDGRRSGLIAVPAISLVWANLHSLAFLGPATVLWHGLLAALEERGPKRFRDRPPERGLARDLFVAGGASAVTLLVNPYGWSAWTFPLTLFSRIGGGVEVFERILEFSRPLSSPGDPALRFFWILLGVLALSVVAIAPRVPPARLASFLPFLALALLARRNVPLLAVAVVPVLAANLAEIGRRWRLSRGSLAAPGAVFALGVAILAGASPSLLGLWRDRGLAVAPDLFPDDCLAALDEIGADGNLFHDLDFGGYLVWRNPERRSFIDGRLEVAGADWFGRFVAAHEDPRAWERMRRSWKLEVLLLEHAAAGSAAFLRSLLASGEWYALCHSPEAVLLVDRSVSPRGSLRIRPTEEDWDRYLSEVAGPAPGAGDALEFLAAPLQRAVTREPSHFALRRTMRFANLCLTLESIPSARRGYERVLEHEPDEAEALFNLGMCSLREGRPDEARAQWNAALSRVGRANRTIFREALAELVP